MNLDEAQTQFEQRLKALEYDSRACVQFAYTEYTLWHIAGYDFEVQRILNEHNDFWWTVVAGLQQSAYIALGRMFDNDNRTHNLRDLLKHADKWQGIFSREMLERRKVRAGTDRAKAKSYAAKAYELRAGGLDALQAALAEKQAFYKKRVDPIRDQVFAHRQRSVDRDKLFSDLMRRDMEKLFVFPLQLHRALFDLYYDGREPVLDPVPTTIGHVLRNLPPHGSSGWREHLHAAKSANDFLDWLKSVASAED